MLAWAGIRRATDIERLGREMPGVSRERIGEGTSPIRSRKRRHVNNRSGIGGLINLCYDGDAGKQILFYEGVYDMNVKRVCALYFSPTGGTERIARLVAENLAEKLNLKWKFFDITKPENRRKDYHFREDELVVMASPVYAGRLPNKLMPEYKARIFGEGTLAVPICVFGNRSPDESLRELMILMEDNGFRIVGAAAFAGRHAFSDQVGAGRPDESDLDEMEGFVNKVVHKLTESRIMLLETDHSELGAYYTPLKEDGTPAKFLKARPHTDADKCIHCGLCAEECPLGSIDAETMETVGLCIKCQACVRRCPVHARYFEDADFLSHVAMLEKNYKRRAENIVIV